MAIHSIRRGIRGALVGCSTLTYKKVYIWVMLRLHGRSQMSLRMQSMIQDHQRFLFIIRGSADAGTNRYMLHNKYTAIRKVSHLRL